MRTCATSCSAEICCVTLHTLLQCGRARGSWLLLDGRSLGRVRPEAVGRVVEHVEHVAAPHVHHVVEGGDRLEEPLDHRERAHLHVVLERGGATYVARLRAHVDDVDDLEADDLGELDEDARPVAREDDDLVRVRVRVGVRVRVRVRVSVRVRVRVSY